jgi:hypothetical protein
MEGVFTYEVNNMTIDQITQKLHEIDLVLRPQVVFVHPDDHELIIQSIPDINSRVKLISTKAVDKGHAIMMDRAWLES